ncbi:alpha/beta hydrolase [Clostridium rectalis]|uniref:alpha/beta hydrolase n=1 Tax=Clostridium rectalis TaxID=2040295 RepID=UPI000F631218|nr:alpha/beta fold hydrolase [Clostridium rectalis]
MEYIVVFFIIFIILLEFFSIYIVKKFSYPKVRNIKNLPTDYGMSIYEEVVFKSYGDDLKLTGYLIKKVNSKKSIIICHGYGDNKFIVGGKGCKQKVDNLKLAKLFLQQDYNVLLFDFRGHGDSYKNAAVTIGYNEQRDLLGAIEFIQSLKLNEKIGIIGFSMGAGTALSILDKVGNIDFVIADSPFSDLKDYLMNNIKIWTGLPKIPFAPLIVLNFKLLYKVKFYKVSPISSVRTSKVPILLIHGKKDITIPYKESVKLKRNCKSSKSKLVLFQNSAHIGSFYLYHIEYEKVIKDFLKEI